MITRNGIEDILLARRMAREQKLNQAVRFAKGGSVHPDLKMNQPIGNTPERMSKMRVDVPVRWQSAPNHPSTHLAYITADEAKLLQQADIHNSGVRYERHIGPAGLPSYDDRGSGRGGTVSGGSAAGTAARGGDTVSGRSSSSGTSSGGGGGGGGGGGSGRDASDAANSAAARQQAERAQAEREKAAADAAAANAARIQAERATYEAQQRAAQQAAANAARIQAEKAAYEKQQAEAAAARAAAEIQAERERLQRKAAAEAQAAEQARLKAIEDERQRQIVRARQQKAVEDAIALQKQKELQYIRSQPATGPTTRGSAYKEAEQTIRDNKVAQKIMGIEISGQKDPFTAKASTSTAYGPGQFTADTWIDAIQTYRPDLFEQYDRQTLLGMRSDGALVESILTKEVANYREILTRNGVAPTEGNMYLSHFLGPDAAAKVLSGNPDASVSDFVSSEAIDANESILKDKTVNQVASWANNKMKSAEPFKAAEIFNAKQDVVSAFAPEDSIVDEVNKIMGKPATQPAANKTGIDSLSQSALLGSGKQKTLNDATQEVTEQDQTQGQDQSSDFDWSKGSWSWDTEDPARKANLYNQPNPFLGEEAPNTVTGDTPESYAKTMGIPVDQVKSRISTMNGFPQVEFYQKEIYDIPGEMVSGLVGGIANLFKPAESKYLGAESDRSSSNQPVTKAGYGPYGDLTLEEYQRQYGGRDQNVASVVAPPVAPAVPPTAVPAPPSVETPVVTNPFVLNPFDYTGRVKIVPTAYSESTATAPRIASSSIDDALSLLNKQRQLPFYTGYRTV